jgi:hypothetical protein
MGVTVVEALLIPNAFEGIYLSKSDQGTTFDGIFEVHDAIKMFLWGHQ